MGDTVFPGPWTYAKGNYTPSWRKDTFFVQAPNPEWTADKDWCSDVDYVCHMATEGNARAIAQLPVLLTLLKEALQGCNQTAYRDWATRAQAAIREIEGETKQ